MATMRRSWGRVALSIIFAALALNAWVQVLLVALGRGDDPAALVAMQVLVGVTGLAAAWGSWRGARWAPAAALAYGIATAAMLVSLGPLLDLPAEARPGILAGAAAMLAGAGAGAWYLRRSQRTRTEHS